MKIKTMETAMIDCVIEYDCNEKIGKEIEKLQDQLSNENDTVKKEEIFKKIDNLLSNCVCIGTEEFEKYNYKITEILDID